MYKIVGYLENICKGGDVLENIYWLFVKQFIPCYMK